MKAICFYFQIHQPFRLKQYRFFNIGNDHYYYDDFANEEIIKRIAQNSYLPANQMLLEMFKTYGKKFKVAFSISGTALEQLEVYVPEFIESMKELVATGCVEFLNETYPHSLASLRDPEEFAQQVKVHQDKIFQLFGQKPKVFRNSELIYDDEIASMIYALGFKGAITVDAKHVLGWKSPNFVYSSASCPKLKLLLKNTKLSEDISARFGDTSWDNFPLNADKYINWIAGLPEDQQIINLFMNYETFGETQKQQTGIFEFMKALPRFAAEKGITFCTPSEAISKLKSVGELSVPYPMSWAKTPDASAWLGNTLQNEAAAKLYSVADRVHMCEDRRLRQDWYYLQSSDHFYYMGNKTAFSPYESNYGAFTNYMNVLSDFMVRLEEQFPKGIDNEELNSLLTTIRNQASEINELNRKVEMMRHNTEAPVEEPKPAAPAPAKKPAAKKAPAKKAAEKKPVEKKVAEKKPAAKKAKEAKAEEKKEK